MINFRLTIIKHSDKNNTDFFLSVDYLEKIKNYYL